MKKPPKRPDRKQTRAGPKRNTTGRSSPAPLLTHAMEDYIKIIYKTQQQHERATTIRIADRLGFSAASVTNMLQKLAGLDIIEYKPYQGAELTDMGERIALEIIRHHRLIELYLAKQMGYSWDAVDAEAEALEHVISEEFEARIDEMLGHPETDPHGAPIPSKEGTIDARRYIPLSQIETGRQAVVRRVSDRDPDVLRRLGEFGLFPDVRIEVIEAGLESDAFDIRVNGQKRRLNAAQAERVYVEIIE